MIRVVLVDDEENALDMLEILLHDTGKVRVVGKYTTPAKAVKEMSRVRADAMFLDIEMPGMNGMDAARTVRTKDPDIPIVFVTAYAEFAIDAFEVESLDYLLKPIRKDRLLQAVQRIEKAVAERPEAPMIRCMGTFAIHTDALNRGFLSWRTNKEKELCAFLVHHRGQIVEQAVLMEALWPESEFRKARSYLYTCTSLLRKNLQASRLPITLHKNESAYSLDIGTMRCDAAELDDLLDRTLKGHGLSEQRMRRLGELYKGEYLENCDFHWAYQRRKELSEKYVRALRALYRHFVSVGQTDAVADCLRSILAVSPDSEPDGRELIKWHIRTGNRNEAIKVYRQLERTVRELLDVGLDDETVELYRALLAPDAGEDGRL